MPPGVIEAVVTEGTVDGGEDGLCEEEQEFVDG